LVQFRDQDLTQAINGLGRVAIAIAESVNEQHALGLDLENNLGGLFFNDMNDTLLARSRVIANGNNTPPTDQVLRINITEPSELTIEDYEVRFEGPSDSDFTIIHMSDRSVALRGALQGVFPATVELDGFELQFESGTFKIGDKFTLLPTRGGATRLEQEIDRVEELAFASPIRAQANSGNIGNAVISLGTMLDIENPVTGQPIALFATPGQISPDLGIRFITESVYEIVDLSDPANPAPLDPPMNNLHYNPGVSNPLFNDEPGANMVVAAGADTLLVPAPVAAPGPYVNGYGAQTLNFLNRDPDTGVVTSQTVSIAANSSAKDIATAVSAVSGANANAYTLVRLDNFVDDGDPTPLGLTINGEVLTVTAPDVFGPDTLAELINDNATLQDLDIVAVSDGVSLTLRATTGADIEVVVTGVGDSIDVSKLDPYSAGLPVLATQTVGAGQGVSVGGAIDVTLSEGASFTANVASVFEQAPVGRSTYLGIQFEIQGEPQAGDRFSIRYNTDGVSDNRNARAIAALETQGEVANGIITYGEAYSQIVEEIGTVTNRARLDSEAAKALLDQSVEYRESISGVNLDEEAGRLIQFQAAYNASSQVVKIARELFDTLLASFR
jgi:flagellar hook-associated protein 1 FlgK